MPITRSAIKKLRQDKKRDLLNTGVKRKVKETIKKFKLSPSDKLLSLVFSALDTAKKKKIYHRNKVARLKSHLSKLISSPSPKVKKSFKKA